MENTDKEIIELLKTDGEKAMERIYTLYYNYLCHATYKILKDSVTTEDIVQDVLMEIWKKKETININISLKAYLRRASINKALNFLRGKKMKFEDDESIKETFVDNDDSLQRMEYQELSDVIDNTIESLPEKCRLVFSMSRFEYMSYMEIATKLGISVKTVENQISKALRILRASVKEHEMSGRAIKVLDENNF
jgi:RNA polymerase sigma-70 factor (ECF subfamily)